MKKCVWCRVCGYTIHGHPKGEKCLKIIQGGTCLDCYFLGSRALFSRPEEDFYHDA